MNLTKLLRRYSRVLLMVFMSLLLVVFLVGTQLQEWAERRSNPTVKIGTSNFGDIELTDTLAVQTKKNLLERMGFADVQRVEPVELYLLIEEARRMGIRVGRDQVRSMFQQSPNVAQIEKQLAALQQQTGRSFNAMYDVAGEWLAVDQLVRSQADAFGNSVPRAELAFRDQRQQAEIVLSVLDSRAFVAMVAEPTEEELQAFFEERKERATAHTEDALEFGYVLPDRVRLEWLTVDPQKVETEVRIREREAQRFFEEFGANYTKSIAADPAASQPAGTPNQPAASVPQTYEEAREQVRNDCRVNKSILEAQSLMNEIRQAAFEPWQTQPRDEQGFREAPPESALVSFLALQERFSDRYRVEYGLTELLDAAGVLAEFDPRPAYIRQYMGTRGSPEPVYVEGRTQLPLSQLAFRVQGLFEKPEVDDADARARDTLPVLAVFEPSPLLQKQGTNRGTRQPGPTQSYIFRVVEVAPSGPPASLDDVREQLTEDYKLWKAHELAGEHARQLAEAARLAGLKAAVEGNEELAALLTVAEEQWQAPAKPDPNSPPQSKPQYVRALGPNEPTKPVTRASTSLQWVGQNTQKVQNEVFALADAGTAEAGAGENIKVVEVSNLFKWAVVELEGIKPMYAGEFDEQRPVLLGPVSGQAYWQTYSAIKQAWMYRDNVRQRCGFVLATEEGAPAE